MKSCLQTVTIVMMLIVIASLNAGAALAEEKADNSPSSVAQQIAAAIIESAKALNVSVDQLSKSDVGRILYWSLWWKFIGQTIWHIVVSSILFVALNIMLWRIGKRMPAILEYMHRNASSDVEFGFTLVGIVVSIGVVFAEIKLIANIIAP